MEREDTVYVAKPVKRPDVDVADEAGKVVRNLKNNLNREGGVDQKLVQAMRAVEMLKRLNAKSDEKVKKCEANKARDQASDLGPNAKSEERAKQENKGNKLPDSTSKLKERALKALDELEALL